MIGFSGIARTVLATALILTPLAAGEAEEAMSASQKKAIEKVVEEFILEHPEVVIESMRRMEQRRKDAENAAVARVIKLEKKVIFDGGSPFAGPANGDVVMVEFFDYHCGVCKQVLPIIQKVLKTDPKVKLVYKEWPILGPDSVVAARAALASHKQGKYVDFHNAMMAASGRLTKKRILTIAAQVGLDPVKLESDMNSSEITGILSRNLELAEKLTLNGTPSFIVGDTLVRGGKPYESMMALIAKERKRAKDGT